MSAGALKSPALALSILYLIMNMTVAVNNPVPTVNSAEVAVKLHRTATYSSCILAGKIRGSPEAFPRSNVLTKHPVIIMPACMC